MYNYPEHTKLTGYRVDNWIVVVVFVVVAVVVVVVVVVVEAFRLSGVV